MTFNQQDGWQYLVLWEFLVRAGMEKEFENVYGPEGEWAQCFRRGQGYFGTELSRDLTNPQRYVTIDFWRSQAAYEAFKLQHAAAYTAIDKKCQQFTMSERELGRFERVGLSTEIRELKTGN